MSYRDFFTGVVTSQSEASRPRLLQKDMVAFHWEEGQRLCNGKIQYGAVKKKELLSETEKGASTRQMFLTEKIKVCWAGKENISEALQA